MADVELEVPARAEYVGLVRMVVSALVIARRDVAEETVDDLSLAVSEACTLAVGEGSIVVACTEQDDAVVVEVRGRIGARPDLAAVVNPFPLMQALVDEVEMSDDLVRLRLRCGPFALRRSRPLAVCVAALTAACSGGHARMPAPVGPSPATVVPDAADAAFCTHLIGMSQQLARLLSGTAAAPSAANFDALAALYADLGRSSPPAIRPTVTDVVDGLREAATAVADASHPDAAKLQDFARRAEADTGRLTSYTAAHCANR